MHEMEKIMIQGHDSIIPLQVTRTNDFQSFLTPEADESPKDYHSCATTSLNMKVLKTQKDVLNHVQRKEEQKRMIL